MRLVSGKGSEATGACWMSAIHYYVRKDASWSDHPDCVSPVIQRLCVRLNDKCESDDERERLIGPHLFEPIGTNTGRADDVKRAYLIADRTVGVFAPWFLRRSRRKDLLDHASALESLSPIVDRESAAAARQVAQGTRAAAYADAAAAADIRKFTKAHLLALILDCCKIGTKIHVKPTRTNAEMEELVSCLKMREV